MAEVAKATRPSSAGASPVDTDIVGFLQSPDFLQPLDYLRTFGTQRLFGEFIGQHQSYRLGSNGEFAEYREYVPGDDPRYVAWKAYARSGQMFVKQHHDYEQTFFTILIDVSASMDGVFRSAQICAAAFAYLALRNQDRVRLIPFSRQPRLSVPLFVGQSSYSRFVNALNTLHPRGPSDVAKALVESASTRARPGVTVIITDFLDADLNHCFNVLPQQKGNTYLMHCFDPRLFFPDVPLFEAEAIENVKATMGVDLRDEGMRQAVAQNIEAFERDLYVRAQRNGSHFLTLHNDNAVSKVLEFFNRQSSATR